MLAEQIGLNAALAALQGLWTPAVAPSDFAIGAGGRPTGEPGVYWQRDPQAGARSPEQAAAAQQTLQRPELALQPHYLGQAAPQPWIPMRPPERLDPNVRSRPDFVPRGRRAALPERAGWQPSGMGSGAAPGGVPAGHGGPPQGVQAAQLTQQAAALLAAYGTCAPDSAEVRRRRCHASSSLAHQSAQAVCLPTSIAQTRMIQAPASCRKTERAVQSSR